MARGRERKPMLVGGAIALTAALASWGRELPRAHPRVGEPVEVRVAVSHAEGREVTVEVCGAPAWRTDDGDFVALARPDRPCRVVVRRHFGVLQWSTATLVQPGEGKVAVDAPDVDAVLPLVLLADGHGARVMEDWGGTGLEGQWVASCEGLSAEGELADWHMALAGAPGEHRDCTTSDGQTHALRLQALDFGDWMARRPR